MARDHHLFDQPASTLKALCVVAPNIPSARLVTTLHDCLRLPQHHLRGRGRTVQINATRIDMHTRPTLVTTAAYGEQAVRNALFGATHLIVVSHACELAAAISTAITDFARQYPLEQVVGWHAAELHAALGDLHPTMEQRHGA